MKLIDLTLNTVIALTVTIFLAYVGYDHFDFGIFHTLPEQVTQFFLGRRALEFIALALLVTALAGKTVVVRTMKREEAGNQT